MSLKKIQDGREDRRSTELPELVARLQEALQTVSKEEAHEVILRLAEGSRLESLESLESLKKAREEAAREQVQDALRKDLDDAGPVAAGPVDSGASRAKSPDKKDVLKERISWNWPPRTSNRTYTPTGWGRFYVLPSREDGTVDMVIQFDPRSIESRSQALSFVQAIITRLQKRRPEFSAEFHAADDHYDVTVRDYKNPVLKVAAGLLNSFAMGRLLRGRRSIQAEFSDSDEAYEHQEWSFEESFRRTY